MKLPAEKREEYKQKKLTRMIISRIWAEKKIITPEFIYGLCCLTWYGRKGERPRFDGYGYIFNVRIKTLNDFQSAEIPSWIKKYEPGEIGFSNFYNAYRTSSLNWIRKNFKTINILLRKTANIKSSEDVIAVAEYLNKLPKIPKRNHPSILIESQSLLSPLLACLDPTKKFPVINKRESLKELHKKLKIEGSNLRDKVTVLLDLMKDNRINDSLFLDAAGDVIIKPHLCDFDNKVKHKSKKISPLLNTKPEGDVEHFRDPNYIKVARKHNSLTNKLLVYCKLNCLNVVEGPEDNKYDALILKYFGNANLLIEAKGSSAPSEIRLAIGQLMDYSLDLDKKTILAVLLPNNPEKRYLRLLKKHSIHVIYENHGKLFGFFRKSL